MPKKLISDIYVVNNDGSIEAEKCKDCGLPYYVIYEEDIGEPLCECPYPKETTIGLYDIYNHR